MRSTEKEKLKNQTNNQYLWLRFKNGCKSLYHSRIRRLLLLLFYVSVFLIWFFNKDRFHLEDMSLASPVFIALSKFILPIVLIGGTCVLLILYGTPFSSNRITNAFQRIGLTNSAGETPLLTAKHKDELNREVIVFEFEAVGIPLMEWENKSQRIEAALNVRIVKLIEGKNKRTILLYAVPANNNLSEQINWKDEYLVQDCSTLVLGRSLLGMVTVDLAKIPHILLGGSTGSGKSVLLKLLLMQAVKKNAIVTIADFKGGVDFPGVWHDKCQMCFDEDLLLKLLSEFIEELQRRKTIFRENGSPNLMEYNKRTGENLRRYIFACDEISELLDKTGLTKEKKEKVSLIESKLAVIARQGRAFGIHLILATQRPDATILSGQIRNNIDCRICGRADKVLSQIILDSSAAAEQIPKNTAGRFLLYDGTIFQAFWFDENCL